MVNYAKRVTFLMKNILEMTPTAVQYVVALIQTSETFTKPLHVVSCGLQLQNFELDIFCKHPKLVILFKAILKYH